MGTRLKVALVLAIALIGVIVWQVSQQREPVYKGKRLSEWLKALCGRGSGSRWQSD